MGKQWKQWETLFFFLGSKVTADGYCNHEIKKCLLLGRKAMTNLDITLPTKVLYTLPTKVKAMVFPVVMYGCQCWTIKKAESESEVAQSCPTLCNPMDCSLPGFSIHGIFQARILEWVAISFSRRSSQPRDWTWVSHIVGRRFTIWTTRKLST